MGYISKTREYHGLCIGSNHDVMRVAVKKAKWRQETVESVFDGNRPLRVDYGLGDGQAPRQLCFYGKQLQAGHLGCGVRLRVAGGDDLHGLSAANRVFFAPWPAGFVSLFAALHLVQL